MSRVNLAAALLIGAAICPGTLLPDPPRRRLPSAQTPEAAAEQLQAAADKRRRRAHKLARLANVEVKP